MHAKTVYSQGHARFLPGGDDAPPVYFRYNPPRLPRLRIRTARNPFDGEPLDPAGQVRRRGRQAPVQDSQFGRLRRRTVGRGGSLRVENLRKGAALRPYGAFRPLRRAASGRTDVPFQTLSDSARVARRPPPEGPLPRILPVRRRCDRHAFAAVRSRAGGDRRAGLQGAGYPRGAEDEQPQDSFRYRRGHRPRRQDDGHHHRHRQVGKDRTGQCEGRTDGARIGAGSRRKTSTDTRIERR